MSPPITILLLKTRSQPSDNYAIFLESFSSSEPSATTTTPTETTTTSSSAAPLFTPTFIPVLRHAFNLTPLLTAFAPSPHGIFLPTYGAAIFTSQRAVEALDQALDQLSASSTNTTNTINTDLDAYYDTHGKLPPLYTVGPATSAALQRVANKHFAVKTRSEKLGGVDYPVLGRETGNGGKLAEFILGDYDPPAPAEPVGGLDGARRPLLFFVGEQRRDIIPRTLMSTDLSPERRVRVDEVVVYDTVVEDGFEAEFGAELRRASAEGHERIWVVVFSPAGCEAMLRVLGWTKKGGWPKEAIGEGGRRRYHVATIGPTTRDILWDGFGFEADVCAERPSAEGVAEGIEEFMRREKDKDEK